MLKHIGRHSDNKVVIVFHQVPGEDHMCLLVYSDKLPALIHDSVMRSLESPQGQEAMNLSDVLFREFMADGRNILETLHKSGLMKKVPTSQVIMTPTRTASIRLDELNSMLTEMAKGNEATKKMADLDRQIGLQRRPQEPREVGMPANLYDEPIVQGETVLSDEVIAADLLKQAARMKADAEVLLAESARLSAEAESMVPPVQAAPKVRAKPAAKVAVKAKTTPEKAPTNVNAKKAKKV